jgi:hypothetical protein
MVGSPRTADRLRALLRARHSSSLAAQLDALDSGCCAASAGCTAPLAFLPTFGSAHGTGCDHAVRACEGQTAACDREPLDFEDGAMASRTTALASLPPTVPRRAWQIANSVSQLLTSDASGRGNRGNRAWHTTTLNVNSATRIVALLQPTGGESAAAIPDPPAPMQ